MDELYGSLIKQILGRKKEDQPLIIGVNGIDGSGKTFLSNILSKKLEYYGFSICILSVDNFHYPKKYRYKNSPSNAISYYKNSINFNALIKGSLLPISSARKYPIKCQIKSLNLEFDQEDIQFQTIYENTIVLVEGVFLFQPEILPFLEFKIFVDAHFDTILERVIIRDKKTLGSEENIRKKYLQKYIPGQKLYLKEVAPQKLADVVIDNNDYKNPILISKV